MQKQSCRNAEHCFYAPLYPNAHEIPAPKLTEFDACRYGVEYSAVVDPADSFERNEQSCDEAKYDTIVYPMEVVEEEPEHLEGMLAPGGVKTSADGLQWRKHLADVPYGGDPFQDHKEGGQTLRDLYSEDVSPAASGCFCYSYTFLADFIETLRTE